jgi:hypothetical protein
MSLPSTNSNDHLDENPLAWERLSPRRIPCVFYLIGLLSLDLPSRHTFYNHLARFDKDQVPSASRDTMEDQSRNDLALVRQPSTGTGTFSRVKATT